ncbi:hypothetical protein VTH06DRAFT_3787 [Thermothelomyces fergusii]
MGRDVFSHRRDEQPRPLGHAQLSSLTLTIYNNSSAAFIHRAGGHPSPTFVASVFPTELGMEDSSMRNEFVARRPSYCY